MRFLVDMPLSPRTADWLVERGHDAVHAFHMGLGTAPDRALLERAASEGRIVITADTDFPYMLALSGAAAPGVVLFRGGNHAEDEIQELLSRVLGAVPEATLTQSICVADRKRIRCRRLPLR